MTILLRAVRVVDPIKVLDLEQDVLLKDGMIIEMGKAHSIAVNADICVIDGSGKVFMPGLYDMHVHLREPGYTYKEDIETGTASAARGGVTGVLAMPNTNPTVESRQIVSDIQKRIAEKAKVDVHLTGSITCGLQGAQLSDLEGMMAQGILAITDDGRTTMSTALMKEAMEIIQPKDLVLISHAEDHDMVKGGAIHEGEVSGDLGIKGIPAAAEYQIVARDIEIAKETGARLHIAHISTKESVALVKAAQEAGLMVTAEAGPHHFILTDDLVRSKGTLAKVNPPLRSETHRSAVEQGILEGVISAIATDHAPHSHEEKLREIYSAPFGISGVELSLALTYGHFVKTGKLTWLELAQKMISNPRLILRLPIPVIEVGAVLNAVLFDTKIERIHDNATMVSKGKNTPYEGMTIYGDVVATWFEGNLVYCDSSLEIK